jgi:hypothetical protein
MWEYMSYEWSDYINNYSFDSNSEGRFSYNWDFQVILFVIVGEVCERTPRAYAIFYKI